MVMYAYVGVFVVFVVCVYVLCVCVHVWVLQNFLSHNQHNIKNGNKKMVMYAPSDEKCNRKMFHAHA